MKKNEKKLYKSNKNVSDADYDIKKFLIIQKLLFFLHGILKIKNI